ncbi:ABC transporter ATP-binding protein [Pectobacterium polaris]|uniref:ABC transporter ATP-binding protein n=1 Tax=Pectobacterium polaris TaxID=2042057 RepID=UPI001F1FE4B6|nr:ABC transporter ATP-binding protein [Pectobacterium polaris]
MNFFGTGKTAFHTIVLSYKSDPGITIFVGVMTLIQAAIIPLIAASQRWVIDAATVGSSLYLISAVLIGACAYGLQLIGHRVSHNYRNDLSNRIHFRIEQDITEMTSRIPTILHLENSQYVNRIALLKRGTLALANTGWALVQSVSSTFSIILSIWLLASIDPLFATLAFSALLILPLSNRAKNFRRIALEESVETLRREAAIHDIYLDPIKSKEVWISGNGKRMNNVASELWSRVLKTEIRAMFRGAAYEIFGWVLFYFLFGAVLVKTAMDFQGGHFLAGDLVLLISLSGQLQRQLNESVQAMSQTVDGGLVAEHYQWLRDAAESSMFNTSPISVGSGSGIEFRNVSFKYPNSDRVILKAVNLTIPWGTSIGIVGINGAGKTTLVKLLCGLLHPTDGDILIDGEPLSKKNLDAWHSHCTGTFQDFLQLHSFLRESVGVGDLRSMNNDNKIIDAINMSCFDGFIDKFEYRLETQLGKTFEGVELSKGQWQRLAIARGLMRDDALIAVMDEPTASLDPLAENKVFQLFSKRTQSIKNNGGVVVLVSHRFSTVNMTDVILVLEDGGVAEIGSHEELMRKRGKYSSLYRLQAKAYA